MDPESTTTPAEPDTAERFSVAFGPVKITPTMAGELDEARPGAMNKQQQGREAFQLWLAQRTMPPATISILPPTPRHLVWWVPEGARRSVTRIALPDDVEMDGDKEIRRTSPPAYLVRPLDSGVIFNPRTRPRGRIFNQEAFPGVDVLDVERNQARRPVARFIWGESCAGLIVKGEDLHFLADAPGFLTTTDLRRWVS